MRKLVSVIVIILIVVLVIGGLGYLAYRTFFGGSGTITVWTLPGTEKAVTEVSTIFHTKYPSYNVKIEVIPEQVFEYKTLFSLASKQGPDVVIWPNEWMEQHRDKLVSAPDGSLGAGIDSYKRKRSEEEQVPQFPASNRSNTEIISQDYGPAVATDVVAQDRVWGVPLNMDTLALFYDRTKISTPPKTWQEVTELTKRFTQRSGDTITRSAIALGDDSSVSHGLDILTTLMLQNGTQMVDAPSQVATFNISKTGALPPGTNALDYYTSFILPKRDTYTWHSSLGNSLKALKDGKTLMALGYLNDLETVSPAGQTAIEVAPVPQALPSSPKTYARYLVAGVTKQAEAPDASWNFVRLFTNPDVSEAVATELGSIPARLDVAKRITLPAKYKVFQDQASYATTWSKRNVEQADRAFDDALDLVLSKGSSPQIGLDVASKAYTVYLQSPSGVETDPEILSFWQSTDDNTDYRDSIVEFVSDAKELKRIAVSRHDPAIFEWELLNAMAAQHGPDIVLLPNDWIARFQPALRSFLKDSFNPSDGRLNDLQAVQRLYVPAVGTDNVINSKIYGMPAHIETLMLAYNVDMFNDLRREKNLAGDEAYVEHEELFTQGPLYWNDLKTMAQIATKRSGEKIDRAFVALGTGDNVAHSADLYATLVKQHGGQMTDPDRLVSGIHLPVSSQNTTVPGQQAESLYKSFAQSGNAFYTWNKAQPNSLDALADGKVMAAFIYPRDVRRVAERNPQINLKFFPMPQVSDKGEPVDFASYYSLALPLSAKRPNDAFAFIQMIVRDQSLPEFISPRKDSVSVATIDRAGRTDVQEIQKNTAQSYYKGVFPSEIDAALRGLLDSRLTLQQAADKMNVSLQKKLVSP